MDEDRFSRLLGDIYETALDQDGHDRVLRQVLETTGSHLMLIGAVSLADKTAMEPRYFGDLSGRMLDGIADYEAGASALDPTLPYLVRDPHEGYFATDVHMTRDQHAAHPYLPWNRHFIGGSHWLARCELRDGLLFTASLHPREGTDPHGARERQMFGMLFGHMAKAWRLAVRPPDMASEHEALALLNGAGKVEGLSQAAQALLAARDGVELQAGELLPSDRRIQPRWRAAVARVLRSGVPAEEALLLPRSGDAKPLAATIRTAPRQGGLAAYSRGALIRLVDPGSPPPDTTRTLMQLWRLTPAEARLVQVLVETGFGLREAGDRLGVTYATVRTQLASVFAKTDTRSQPELMRLVTRLSG